MKVDFKANPVSKLLRRIERRVEITAIKETKDNNVVIDGKLGDSIFELEVNPTDIDSINQWIRLFEG